MTRNKPLCPMCYCVLDNRNMFLRLNVAWCQDCVTYASDDTLHSIRGAILNQLRGTQYVQERGLLMYCPTEVPRVSLDMIHLDENCTHLRRLPKPRADSDPR
jgi:hypothetical protein